MKIYKWLVAGALAGALFLPAAANAQGLRTIDAGTTITVRTNEWIQARYSDGRVYSGQVERNVMNRAGRIAIPRGSNVELLVRNISRDEIAVDLEAVYVLGERYGIDAQDTVSGGNDMGANRQTGEFVGGGAAIGAIIGAIAGGGKGAVIGGAVGAAAGANAQIMTRGREVTVPAESLITFRLEQPLRMGAGDRGYIRDGQHYHPGYDAPPPPPPPPPSDSEAYREGLQRGREDFDRNQQRDPRSDRWNREDERRDYQAGYDRGYQDRNFNGQDRSDRGNPNRNPPPPPQQRAPTLQIGGDHNIIWDGAPPNARIYAQTDNGAPKLFATGGSGKSLASWIVPGHLFTFILQDANGNEITRQQLDLRSRRGPR